MTKLIDYSFMVKVAGDDGEVLYEKNYKGAYECDAQAELNARHAAAEHEGASGIIIRRDDTEWHISAT